MKASLELVSKPREHSLDMHVLLMPAIFQSSAYSSIVRRVIRTAGA